MEVIARSLPQSAEREEYMSTLCQQWLVLDRENFGLVTRVRATTLSRVLAPRDRRPQARLERFVWSSYGYGGPEEPLPDFGVRVCAGGAGVEPRHARAHALRRTCPQTCRWKSAPSCRVRRGAAGQGTLSACRSWRGLAATGGKDFFTFDEFAAMIRATAARPQPEVRGRAGHGAI